jgi:MATE family multidrug resistance protein
VLALAVPVLAIAGWFLILDGGQGVMVGALRGLGDIWVPSAMVQAGFWGVTVPLGHHLAFARGMGVPGLFWALCAGALTAWLLLLLRFARVSRREVRPV